MPNSRKKCKNCYNKHDKTCCNRTAGSWVKVLTYHISFLCLIIGMLLMYIFSIERHQREFPEEPSIKKLDFVGERGPGATMIPHLEGTPTINYINTANTRQYISDIDHFITKQNETCVYMYKTTGRNCSFNTDDFGPCGRSPYGYDERKPCVFIRLNKIPTWAPEKYGSKSSVPKDARVSVDPTRNVIHVSCQGVYPSDLDILGEVKYYPEPLFSEKHFPLPKGLSTNPVIAIQMSNITSGVLGAMKCHMYAKNLIKINTRMYFYLEQV